MTGAGPGGGPHVVIYGAATNTILQSFFAYDASMSAGVEVAAGDVNGDGVPDIITAPGPSGAPLVRIFDGRSAGTLLREFLAMPATFAGGLHVASGDVNGDGSADIIVGSGLGTAAQVQVFNGVTGAVLRTLSPFASGFGGGVFVAAGDVNGDGYADIVTGAGPGGGPIVRVYDGATGAPMGGTFGAFYAYPAAFGGGVHVAAGDLDGDGVADVITGPGPGGGPHIRIFSGASASELFGFFAFTASSSSGAFVAAPPAMPRMAVDLPVAGTVSSPVRIAGWAFEEAAVDGTDTDAVHAWAYPVGGGAGIFVGAATARTARADVASAFGGEFLQSGFDFTGTLPAGTYDLVISVRNSLTGLFDDRRVVRITVR